MRVVADSSAWIEFLRATGSAIHLAMRRILAEDPRAIGVPGIVRAELLGGARDERDAHRLLQMLSACAVLPLSDPHDYESAAALRRTVRESGATVLTTDCLIAWAAIREGVELLHRDRHFDLIAEATPLRVMSA